MNLNTYWPELPEVTYLPEWDAAVLAQDGVVAADTDD